jgi:2-polyprenyl-3-methyl-5-hydroxy-6-metoxy-1,4-benzoquinol methylase
MLTRKAHWENVYERKNFEAVSWFQEMPTTSIEFLQAAQLPKSAKIIDIGGGESRFVDYLLAAGYENITVLDISATAIEKKKQALGEQGKNITWIVSDILDFKPSEKYDFWHDRATFHFLTQPTEVKKYVTTLKKGIQPNGILVIGTFSESGPTKCSGLEIKQYSASTLATQVSRFFEKIKCIDTEHLTPFETVQHFVFCSFKRLAA